MSWSHDGQCSISPCFRHDMDVWIDPIAAQSIGQESISAVHSHAYVIPSLVSPSVQLSERSRFLRQPAYNASPPASLPTRTQRPVKSPNAIHILPILRLLLFPHAIHVVSLHLGVLR